MDTKQIFLFFGISAAALAVIVTVIGLRSEKFPSPRAMYALLVLTFVLLAGTGYYSIELSIEEAEERKEHSKEVVGEEASVVPLRAESGI